MKKFLTTFLLLILCIGLEFGATWTFVTTSFTQVGSTTAFYIPLQNPSGRYLGYKRVASYPGNQVSIDVNYTKGDETTINFTYAFAYKTSYATAPVLADYSYMSTNAAAVAKDTRTITGTSRWTFKIDVPDRASHLVIVWGNTGGSPTATSTFEGYVSRMTGGEDKR